MSGVALLFILLIGLMMASVPVGISLGLSTLVTMVLTTNLDVITIPQYCFRGLDSFPLMAIPFFMLAGNLMKFGGLSEKLINLSNSLVRGFKGGLGHVTVLASMFFAALSGSAPATVMAIGSNVIPQMEKHGYDRGYATALASTAGTIGVIIPPSIPFVIYGVVSGASISDLFVAGIIPGILIGIVLMVVNYIYARKYGYGGEGRASFREFLHELKDAIWALLVPVIILGGIYGGIFTPTEASVVAVAYGIIVGMFVYKNLTLKDLWQLIVKTATNVGGFMLAYAPAACLGSTLILLGVTKKISHLLLSISSNIYVILFIVTIFLMIAGMFLDTTSNLVVFGPILYSVLSPMGVNVIHLGVIMIVCLAVGFVTPPVCMNVFVASNMTGLSMEEIVKPVWPQILAMFFVCLLLAFVPSLSLVFI